MADEKKTETATIKCNLKNPTQARRVIYNGISVQGLQGQGNIQKAITVESGGEVKGVTLSRATVEELQTRNKQNPNSDLIVEAA